MCNLRKLVLLAIGSISVNAFAEDWIKAESLNSPIVGSVQDYSECTYRINKPFSSLDGEIITIRVKRSYCPHSIEYNPESNSWRE